MTRARRARYIVGPDLVSKTFYVSSCLPISSHSIRLESVTDIGSYSIRNSRESGPDGLSDLISKRAFSQVQIARRKFL